MQGRIVKGVGGFYYVDTDQGVYQCRARGLFKKDGITPTVGDLVTMEVTHEGDREGVVLEIHPRKNIFVRPPISNVDTVVVMMAAKDPDPNWQLLDKFLVTAEMSDVRLVVALTKVDLADEATKATFHEIYDNLYPTLEISCRQGLGIEELKAQLTGQSVALTGPSGVGKSTLLNLLHEQAEAETGSVSGKTGRGRHTTRHVEIFSLEGGGLIYDTPGFTSLDAPPMDEEELAHYFPEMRDVLGTCRFDNCRHLKEPDCAVTAKVAAGQIAASRYDSYVALMADVKAQNEY